MNGVSQSCRSTVSSGLSARTEWRLPIVQIHREQRISNLVDAELIKEGPVMCPDGAAMAHECLNYAGQMRLPMIHVHDHLPREAALFGCGRVHVCSRARLGAAQQGGRGGRGGVEGGA